jgi:drug/metabolite transporter (DMT)-like permease
MPYILQLVTLLVLGAILVQFLKPFSLRKWLGVVLLAGGLVGIFTAGQQQVLGFDLELLALLAVPLGVVLWGTRRRFVVEG